MTTPVRAILRPESLLHESVEDGLGALKRAHRELLDPAIRTEFDDSIDLDEATRVGRDGEYGWDYLLGHRANAQVIALEPHSATTSEVSVVIAKRARAQEQLREHVKAGMRVAEWYWVASGRVDFVPHDKQINRLNAAGIKFVGSRLGAKHLPGRETTGRKTTK